MRTPAVQPSRPRKLVLDDLSQAKKRPKRMTYHHRELLMSTREQKLHDIVTQTVRSGGRFSRRRDAQPDKVACIIEEIDKAAQDNRLNEGKRYGNQVYPHTLLTFFLDVCVDYIDNIQDIIQLLRAFKERGADFNLQGPRSKPPVGYLHKLFTRFDLWADDQLPARDPQSHSYQREALFSLFNDADAGHAPLLTTSYSSEAGLAVTRDRDLLSTRFGVEMIQAYVLDSPQDDFVQHVDDHLDELERMGFRFGSHDTPLLHELVDRMTLSSDYRSAASVLVSVVRHGGNMFHVLGDEKPPFEKILDHYFTIMNDENYDAHMGYVNGLSEIIRATLKELFNPNQPAEHKQAILMQAQRVFVADRSRTNISIGTFRWRLIADINNALRESHLPPDSIGPERVAEEGYKKQVMSSIFNLLQGNYAKDPNADTRAMRRLSHKFDLDREFRAYDMNLPMTLFSQLTPPLKDRLLDYVEHCPEFYDRFRSLPIKEVIVLLELNISPDEMTRPTEGVAGSLESLNMVYNPTDSGLEISDQFVLDLETYKSDLCHWLETFRYVKTQTRKAGKEDLFDEFLDHLRRLSGSTPQEGVEESDGTSGARRIMPTPILAFLLRRSFKHCYPYTQTHEIVAEPVGDSEPRDKAQPDSTRIPVDQVNNPFGHLMVCFSRLASSLSQEDKEKKLASWVDFLYRKYDMNADLEIRKIKNHLAERGQLGPLKELLRELDSKFVVQTYERGRMTLPMILVEASSHDQLSVEGVVECLKCLEEKMRDYDAEAAGTRPYSIDMVNEPLTEDGDAETVLFQAVHYEEWTIARSCLLMGADEAARPEELKGIMQQVCSHLAVYNPHRPQDVELVDFVRELLNPRRLGGANAGSNNVDDRIKVFLETLFTDKPNNVASILSLLYMDNEVWQENEVREGVVETELVDCRFPQFLGDLEIASDTPEARVSLYKDQCFVLCKGLINLTACPEAIFVLGDENLFFPHAQDSTNAELHPQMRRIWGLDAKKFVFLKDLVKVKELYHPQKIWLLSKEICGKLTVGKAETLEEGSRDDSQQGDRKPGIYKLFSEVFLRAFRPTRYLNMEDEVSQIKGFISLMNKSHLSQYKEEIRDILIRIREEVINPDSSLTWADISTIFHELSLVNLSELQFPKPSLEDREAGLTIEHGLTDEQKQEKIEAAKLKFLRHLSAIFDLPATLWLTRARGINSYITHLNFELQDITLIKQQFESPAYVDRFTLKEALGDDVYAQLWADYEAAKVHYDDDDLAHLVAEPVESPYSFYSKLEEAKRLPDLKLRNQRIFAILFKASSQVLGMVLQDNQAITLMGIIRGLVDQNILAQVGTGQGKTLINALVAIYEASVNGRNVDVHTSTQELAKSNMEVMKPLYDAFRVTVGTEFVDIERNNPRPTRVVYSMFKYVAAEYAGALNQLVSPVSQSVQGKSRPICMGDIAVIDEADILFFNEENHSFRTGGAVVATLDPDDEEYRPLQHWIDFIYEQVKARLENDVYLTVSSHGRREVQEDILAELKAEMDEAIERSEGGHLALSELEKNYLDQFYKPLALGVEFAFKEHAKPVSSKFRIKDNVVETRTETNSFSHDVHPNGAHYFYAKIKCEEDPSLTLRETHQVRYIDLSFKHIMCQYDKIAGVTGTIGSEEEREKIAREFSVVVRGEERPLRTFNTPKIIGTQRPEALPMTLSSDVQSWKMDIVNASIDLAKRPCQTHPKKVGPVPVLILVEDESDAREINELIVQRLQSEEPETWRTDHEEYLDAVSEGVEDEELELRSGGESKGESRVMGPVEEPLGADPERPHSEEAKRQIRLAAMNGVQLLDGRESLDEIEDIVREAGDLYSVTRGMITVATTVAGRGVDIRPTREAQENGGQQVLIGHFFRSERDEQQAIGRAARYRCGGSYGLVYSLPKLKAFCEGVKAKAIEKKYPGELPEIPEIPEIPSIPQPLFEQTALRSSRMRSVRRGTREHRPRVSGISSRERESLMVSLLDCAKVYRQISLDLDLNYCGTMLSYADNLHQVMVAFFKVLPRERNRVYDNDIHYKLSLWYESHVKLLMSLFFPSPALSEREVRELDEEAKVAYLQNLTRQLRLQAMDKLDLPEELRNYPVDVPKDAPEYKAKMLDHYQKVSEYQKSVLDYLMAEFLDEHVPLGEPAAQSGASDLLERQPDTAFHSLPL